MNKPSNNLLRLPFANLKRSATLEINERSTALTRAGHRVLKLGLGQSPFPVPAHVTERLGAFAGEKDYLPVQGLYELREEICSWHLRTHGLQYQPENIIIGPGSKELLYLFQLVTNLQTVLPNPSWVSYAPQFEMTGRNVQWIHTDLKSEFMVTGEKLKEGLKNQDKTPLLILNSPSNPVGRMLAKDELGRIAEVMDSRRGIILSDEIYGALDFGAPHHSVAHDYFDGTVISGGLSKWCGAGGWRLGYMAFPQALSEILQAISAAASETFTSVSAPIQFAAKAAYENNPLTDAYLIHSKRVLSTLLTTFHRSLAALGLDVPQAQGGFYLFVSFDPHRSRLKAKGIYDDLTLCHALLRDLGVAVLPGQCFGRKPTELLVRMALVDFDGTSALTLSEEEEDLVKFERRFAAQNAELLDLPDKLGEWLNN